MAKDKFSKQASTYAKFRPTYPDELYEFLLEQTISRNAAWDCATGNGQAAIVLSKFFDQVEATDLSEQQLANSTPMDNIQYQLATAENPPFADNCFDLITVAQAVHWFNFDEFYKAARRVAKPNGLLAVWSYGLFRSTDAVDREMLRFYNEVVGEFWDFERSYVEDGYRSLPFPFEQIDTPLFEKKFAWSLSDLSGYLNSWSSVHNFIAANNYNPVDPFIEGLDAAWPSTGKLEMRLPIFLKLGRIIKN